MDNFYKEVAEQIKKEWELGDFFIVDAPDIITENAFIHDLEGNPVDCNIYHPKYGYDGFVADKYYPTITSYKQIVYQDPQTNKTVYCRNCEIVLCLHKDGTLTNKDGKQVVFAHHVSQNQKRLAEVGSKTDFEEIYQRELGKDGYTDKPHTHATYKKTLADYVKNLVKRHRSNAERNKKKANAEWMAVADSFLKYVSNEPKLAPSNANTDKKNDKYDNFLAEVSRLENHILNSGTHYFGRTILQTELYTPLKTLWESYGNEGSKETVDEFKKQVGIYLDYAREAADKFINDFNKEVKKQPDKREELLLENRDWFVKWLADTYRPVDSWYHEFWNEEQGILNIDGLEKEMFWYCHLNNKPFIVALKLMQSLYGYYFALEQFNALIMSGRNITLATSTPPATNERGNTFNHPMLLDEVRRWFIQLSENDSKNGKPFLTVEQVGQFIDRAFCGNNNLQKLTFNMADGERTSITKLFYLFFTRCINDYKIEPTKHRKEKYVRLLTDNFTNYNYDTVFSTFNNSKKAPKAWKITN